MPEYNAPLRDIRFAMNELLDFESHYATLPGAEEATPDMVDAESSSGDPSRPPLPEPEDPSQTATLHLRSGHSSVRTFSGAPWHEYLTIVVKRKPHSQNRQTFVSTEKEGGKTPVPPTK